MVCKFSSCTLPKLKSTNILFFNSLLALTSLCFNATFSSFIVRSLFVIRSSFVRHSFVFCSSFVRLYVAVVPPLEGVRGRFSSSFVRHSFVIRSSFVRHSFVFCSSFVRLLFVFCSSFVRLYVAVVPPLEEASESWVCVRGRLSPLFVCSLFVLSSSYFFRYYTPSPWEKSPNRRVCDWGEDIIFVLLFPLLHSLSLGVDILSADSSLEV